MAPRVLITGATGFIGRRVAATAAARADLGHLRLLVRSAAAGVTAGEEPKAYGGPPTETVTGDLRDHDSLRRACEGVDVLIHCASAIGGDEELLHAVNDDGTRALVDAAVRAGVTRIVALSTASVHGRGPFRAAAPGTLPLAPGSATSRTRAAGERYVTDAGGAVLRPHLVYGAGDRQLIPGLVRLLAALPGPLDAGASLHSVIDVDSLAGVLLGAALSPRTEAGPYYVNHPEPVPVAELLAPCEELLSAGTDRPRAGAVDLAEAYDLLAGHPFGRHHLAMLATDHWFADDRPWRDLGCAPGPGFTAGFPARASWYRDLLAGG
ncbi:NAD-dependent epimerase/dehydratase family protein [Streptomyces stackebrandtii]|uniref:NAD-dependent epimerase/dehydratase family protein n=1 Tax=Streptomyces stackebrandtii TaxID=3051177 RepID=UPI0028DCDFFA|nr:NAD-dependent epimerase/dehydratase family protein [Streptomyces sp. DSM 40976]